MDMKKERDGAVILLFPAILLAALLIALDIAVHITGLNPGTETRSKKSRKITSDAEDPEQKSGNEIQYERLLFTEQALLEELRQLQEGADSGNTRDRKLRMAELEDELHRIQIEKRILQARMEAEKLQ